MESIPKLGKQTISDRLVAAKHTVTGSGLAKAVCKASTEEPSGPKKKHLDYLTQCTNEINVSIPQLADLLIERTQNGNWVVVFKALVTIHHVMGYGNERFIQYLASCNSTFNLGNFLDKSGVAGYDMSPFIRRYSKYLNEKCVAYRQMAMDFCKVKRGKDEGMMRKMEVEKLLKTLPVLQTQVDALLDFEVTADELRNGVINGAFLLLFKDLIRLFACYNDGVINLLEKYFDMNKKQCKEALDLYKKFLVRVDRVSEFLKVAEQVGIDKGGIPDLAKAPSSLLEALEQHYNSMDEKGAKKGGRTTPAPASGEAASTSNGGGSGATTPVLNISESEKKRLIAEEAARMEALKAEADSRLTSSALDLLTIESPALDSGSNSVSTSPSITATSQNGAVNGTNGVTITNGAATDSSAALASKPSDLLFELLAPAAPAPAAPAPTANPFSTSGVPAFSSNAFNSSQAAPAPFANNANPFGASNDLWTGSAPSAAAPPAMSTTNLFASDAQFNQAFASNAQPKVEPQSLSFDPFGEILQPAPAGGSNLSTAPACVDGNPFVDIPNNNKAEKFIKGDVDASLKNLAVNLKITPGGQPAKIEWNSPAVTKLTGGPGATAPAPQLSATTWGTAGAAPAPVVGRGPSPSFATGAFGAGNPMMSAANPMMSGMAMGQSNNFNPFDNNAQTMHHHPTSLGPFGGAHAASTTTFPHQSPIISPANSGPFGAPSAAPTTTHNWGL